MTLADRVLALHRALERARLPHAFGGAIALAYWTSDPRATSDIDLNVFVAADAAADALGALPAGVVTPPGAADAIARDGQVRLWWDETPLDLFFDYVPVHADARRNLRTVPFAGASIPILGPVELAVFKVMFDRTRDWADIEAMVTAGTFDADAVRAALGPMIGAEDERFDRLDQAIRRAQPPV
jgi:hypothetical protein